MCGITGIYNKEGTLDPAWIEVMTNTLKHRGPDDEGYLGVNFSKNILQSLIGNDSSVQGPHIETFNQPLNLALGHRRLSIIDTSPLGHQPMSNNNETLWIVYNGEIYNYIELRKELQNLGYSFRSLSDTEVLLAAYEEWGKECIHKFNGMWSFVIYDIKKNILFGSRDRFGVKPFYYYLDKSYFAFSSEIKALLTPPFVKKNINSNAVFDYLSFNGIEIDEESFFKNIFELKPSHSFTFDLSAGTFKKWKYYILEYTDQWEPFDTKKSLKHIELVKELLYKAVSLRLRSDVAVGSCLSGGIDSSAIVCTINNIMKKEKLEQIGTKQNVFTASYHNPTIDESKWAKIVVNKTKTSWHQTFPEKNELIHDLEDLIYTQDIPFGSTSIYAQYRVMQLAKEKNIKVLLDGQGGDELFTGYTPCYIPFFSEIIKNLDLKTFSSEIINSKNSPLKNTSLLNGIFQIYKNKIIPTKLKNFIRNNKNYNHLYLNHDFLDQHKSRLFNQYQLPTSLNKMLFKYISGVCLKNLLKYEDRNSMRFSVESRTPFADDKHLIEHVFKIPSSYKIHHSWSKYILREATKNILPREIRLRKDKVGFITPENNWLKNNALRSYITKDLDKFIDTNRLLKDWDMLLTSKPRIGFSNLWKFINIAVWIKVYGL
ncbi:asparagine synthase (glutamine-hydrolyzing) [Chlamydiota bacterium]